MRAQKAAKSSGPRQKAPGNSSTIEAPACTSAGTPASVASRSGVPFAANAKRGTTRTVKAPGSRPRAATAARRRLMTGASFAGSCSIGIQPSAISAMRAMLRSLGASPSQIGIPSGCTGRG